jgi:hypothetical protein
MEELIVLKSIACNEGEAYSFTHCKGCPWTVREVGLPKGSP